MQHRWLLTTLLGGTLWFAFAGWHRTLRRRRAQRAEAPPERLQVWDAEGGQNQQYARGRIQ
jgi:hypothetical protein